MTQSSIALLPGLPSAATALAAGKDFFMPELAPLVVLAFLGAAGATLLALLGSLAAAFARRPTLARWIGAGAVLIPAGYFAVLLLFSARSSEQLLRPGDKKYFCEADCHVAYSVENVRVAKTLGPAERSVAAAGEFHVVILKTWFDERSISSYRGDMALTPNPRGACLLDASGRRYLPSLAAERAWSAAGVSSTPLNRPLRPGESYSTTFAFDLPPGARSLRLLIGDTESITRFLIGHENSFFHKKIYFDLSGSETASAGGNRS